MRSLIIGSFSAILFLSSCSVYREGQTPDDVYYSPGRSSREAAGGYVDADGGRDDGRRYENRSSYNGYDDFATADDRWLMMRVRNRYRWSYFDDFNSYSPYGFGYNGWGGYGMGGFGYSPGFSMGLGGFGLGFGYGMYDPFFPSYGFNDYYNWNSYYNPYYPKMIAVNPRTDPGAYNRIRNFNLGTYNNRSYNNSRSVLNPANNRGQNGYNNSNRTLGNSFRRIFSNSNNSTVTPRPRDTYRDDSRNADRPVRVYTPSNNNSNNSTYSPGSSRGSGNSGGSAGSSGSRPSRR